MKAKVISLLLFFLAALSLHAGSFDQEIQQIRTEFEKIGRMDMAWTQSPPDQRKGKPSGYRESLDVLEMPPDLLTEAIDRVLRSGEIVERIGALSVYWLGTHKPNLKLELRPDYQTLLIDLLKADNQANLTYSVGLVTALTSYRSRETVLAFLDTAHRTKNPELRQNLLESSTYLLHMRPLIHNQMTPMEKERTLNELEAWLERNRDRIRFKKDGTPYLAGGESGEKPPELSAEDRVRIRKDPACVLKLMYALMDGDSAGADLAGRCGAALLGAKGAQAFQESLKQGVEEGPPSFDRQMAMASARGGYPTMDAAQLAVAYVAAYETDPATRKLAMEIYDELGTPDIERVLKGEPREVRKKAMQLVDQVTGDDEDED